jgi:energy-coupling factor transport system ATP-binding protein
VNAKDVGYRHRGADDDALADVSTTLVTGSALQVSGPNGSGKTTLARLLGGLVRPTRGEVRAGKSLVGATLRDSRPDRWRAGDLAGRIGSVFQNPEHMFLTGNVRSELALGPRSLGVAPNETATLVDELMERLKLSQLADQNPFTLSGGEQRRLSVAAVLATTPQVLILDEPTFGQDPVTWRELRSLLIARKDQGVGLAVMTHDQEFGDAVCDRSLSLPARAVRDA